MELKTNGSFKGLWNGLKVVFEGLGPFTKVLKWFKGGWGVLLLEVFDVFCCFYNVSLGRVVLYIVFLVFPLPRDPGRNPDQQPVQKSEQKLIRQLDRKQSKSLEKLYSTLYFRISSLSSPLDPLKKGYFMKIFVLIPKETLKKTSLKLFPKNRKLQNKPVRTEAVQ